MLGANQIGQQRLRLPRPLRSLQGAAAQIDQAADAPQMGAHAFDAVDQADRDAMLIEVGINTIGLRLAHGNQHLHAAQGGRVMLARQAKFLQFALQRHEGRGLQRQLRVQALAERRADADRHDHGGQIGQRLVDLPAIGVQDSFVGAELRQATERDMVQFQQPVGIHRIGKHGGEQGRQVVLRGRARQHELEDALAQFAEKGRFARQAGGAEQLRPGSFAQGLLQARLHHLAHIAVGIEPVEQQQQALAPQLAAGSRAGHADAGHVAQPCGDVDHPVGALVPAGERIGLPQQGFDLALVLHAAILAMLGAAAQATANHPHSQEKGFHQVCLLSFLPDRLSRRYPVLAYT